MRISRGFASSGCGQMCKQSRSRCHGARAAQRGLWLLVAGGSGVAVGLVMSPRCRGAAELRGMNPEAVLINVGRGPLVDEAALIAALREKRIGGAALDVFNEEPLLAGHPYFALDNLLLSPHGADHTPDWQQRTMQLFLDNFERYRKGEPLRNVVDKRRGY